MSGEGRLLERLFKASKSRNREVFQGFHAQPTGRFESRVSFGGCKGEVDAQRSTDFAKGSAVTGVKAGPGSYTLLPGPPALQGPDIQGGTAQVQGQAFAAPQGNFAAFLVWYRTFSDDIELGAHAADGTYLATLSTTFLDSVGRSFYPGAAGLSEGTRALIDQDQVVVRDFITGVEHRYSPPAPRLTSNPMVVSGTAYWFEFLPETVTPGTHSTTVRLFASDLTLASPMEINSIDVEISSVREFFRTQPHPFGPDFTNSGGLLWVEAEDGNGEANIYRRVFLPFNGDSGQISLELSSTPDVGPRSGYPAGLGRSIIQGPGTGSGEEQEQKTTLEYSSATNDPDILHTEWVSAEASDISLDHGSSKVWLVNSEAPYEIRSYSLSTGSLMDLVELEHLWPNVVGIHRLQVPLFIQEDEV